MLSVTRVKHHGDLPKKTVIGLLLLIAAIIVIAVTSIIISLSVRRPIEFETKVLAGIDIETVNEWIPYINVNYPRTKNQAVNKELKDFALQMIDDFKEESAKQPHINNELNVSFKTYRLNDNIVSFAFRRFVSLHNTANNSDIFITQTYNLKNGQNYQLSDVFTGKYLGILTNEAFNKLKGRGDFSGKTRQVALKQGLEAKPKNFSNFVLSGNDIIFYFNQYQLGSRGVGAQQVRLKLDTLRDYLQPTFKSIIHRRIKTAGGDKSSAVVPPPPASIDSLAGKKLVALTFDDGPDPLTTNRLLDVLKSEGVKVTFFVVGARTDHYPDVVRRAYKEGHEIGSHTYNHLRLVNLSAADRQAEINNTITAIKNAIGVAPKIMRPPYGLYNDAVLADAGMPVIYWSIDPSDWHYRNADTVTSSVLAEVRDGSIVLMHDLYDTTVEATSRIIPNLKNQGYSFVTVEQLILSRGGSLQPGSVFSAMYP
jgi:peptidoglycan/xylan/chitin deacetylase (PgdA/CDA1 family)